jgi:Holliday junction resolvasome RuvABC endonuclease subunit
MVQIQLPKAKFDGQDSVDALSIALCHAYQYKNQDKLKRAISKAG